MPPPITFAYPALAQVDSTMKVLTHSGVIYPLLIALAILLYTVYENRRQLQAYLGATLATSREKLNPLWPFLQGHRTRRLEFQCPEKVLVLLLLDAG